MDREVFRALILLRTGQEEPADQFVRIHRRALTINETYIPAEVRFHDLRHTYITLQIASGTDPRSVQAIAGHPDIRLTLRDLRSPDGRGPAGCGGSDGRDTF